MKKHFLRTLLVLLTLCLGIGVFAACGGKEDEPDEEPTKYTLTYDLNGGTGTAPAGGSYAEGATVTVASGSGLSKTNSTFDGWLDGTTKVAAGSTLTMPAHNVTLKANWKTNTPDPGPQPGPSDEATVEGVWTGTCKGFFQSDFKDTDFDCEVSVKLAEDGESGSAVIILTLAGEDDSDSMTFAFGCPLTKEDEGFRGSMWINEITYSPVFTVADDTLTITALGDTDFVLDTREDLPAAIAPAGTLYYLYYEGEMAEDDVIFEINFTDKTVKMMDAPMEDVSFANVGKYVLVQISPMPDATISVVVFKDGDSFYSFSAEGEVVELTAEPHVHATRYTVEFDGGEHGDYSSSQSGYQVGEEIDLPAADEVIAHKGYTFDGWYKNDTDKVTTEKYTVAEADAGDTTITFTAHYTAIEYTVEFNKGEVEGDVTLPSVEGTVSLEAEHDSITLSEVTCEGYEFDGWMLNGENIGKTGSHTVVENDLPENSEDHKITLTASWKKLTTYTFNFYKEKADKDTHEAEVIETKTAELVEGAHVTSDNRPESDPENGQYTFDGWYFDNQGVEVEFNDEFIPSDYADKTTFNIYAKWIIVIGKDDLSNGYPGDDGSLNSGIEFKQTIEQGNHYIFTGTQRSAISLEGAADQQNYKSLKFYIWNGDKPNGVFRLDRAVGDGSAWEPDHGRGAKLAEAENWVITMASPTGFGRNNDWLYRKPVQDGTIVFEIDWVNTSVIVIKITLTATAGKAEGYFEQVYTIEGKTDHPLATSYNLGFGAEASQTKFTKYEVTQEALASEFTVGNDHFEMPFTGDTPAWFGNSIKSGSKVVLTGTVQSGGNNAWESPIAYLMSKKGYGTSIFRLDGWLGGAGETYSVNVQEGIDNANTNYNTADGKAAADADKDFLAAMKAGDVALTLTYDWTTAEQIVITAKFEKDTMTRTTIFTVTAPAEQSLAAEYFIGLGGENALVHISSVNYNAATD